MKNPRNNSTNTEETHKESGQFKLIWTTLEELNGIYEASKEEEKKH